MFVRTNNLSWTHHERLAALGRNSEKMGVACAKIHEDYQALVKQWIVDKAAETGLEPKLVREWIEGLYLD